MTVIHPHVYQILNEQHDLVLHIDDPTVTDTAKEIAFYTAMIDAAEDSPLETQAEQDEMMTFLKTKMTSWIAIYQDLVNSHL